MYQLPQVTENEMTPESVRYLADRHPNLFFFKDSSGRDEVERAKIAMRDVFLVRGAEGEYARSLRSGDGPYDGLRVSTANVFARMLHEIICLSQSGRKDEDRITRQAHSSRSWSRPSLCVANLEVGNPFTNANKILDHLMAYGPPAGARPAAAVQQCAAALRVRREGGRVFAGSGSVSAQRVSERLVEQTLSAVRPFPSGTRP